MLPLRTKFQANRTGVDFVWVVRFCSQIKFKQKIVLTEFCTFTHQKPKVCPTIFKYLHRHSAPFLSIPPPSSTRARPKQGSRVNPPPPPPAAEEENVRVSLIRPPSQRTEFFCQVTFSVSGGGGQVVKNAFCRKLNAKEEKSSHFSLFFPALDSW